MKELYSIRATKGFSLDEELRAYDGEVSPVVHTQEEKADWREHIDLREEYAFFEEQERSGKEGAEKASMHSRITASLRNVNAKIGSPAYRRRSRIVPLSRLPLHIEEELGHFMYSSHEVLPEEKD